MIIAENKKTFELVPSGNHIARCYSMIDLGTSYNEMYKLDQHKVRISWELPNEKVIFQQERGEQPFSISKDFTISMNEKANLRKMLESWRGKGFNEVEAERFDITKLLGIPCMLNVIHKTSAKGNQYADIASISPIPKGTLAPDQINSTFEFSLTEWSEDKFNKLPEWIQTQIKASHEYKSIFNPTNREVGNETDNSNDDLPF